jgi:hypothetical protein
MLGSMSDINYQPSIDISSYTGDLITGDLIVANNDTATVKSNVNSNSFYVGLDLENFPTSDRSHILMIFIFIRLIPSLRRLMLNSWLMRCLIVWLFLRTTLLMSNFNFEKIYNNKYIIIIF